MNPTGGTRLDDSQCFGDRQLLVERDKEMHVIRHATGRIEDAALSAEDAPDVLEEPGLDLG
jgi:hypothetical protein